MRISEVAKMTGLTASNIRFYEKKGLLAPARDAESKYRDYTDEDARRLKTILLYRKVGMPIETVYLILNHGIPAGEALKRQEQELISQKEMLEGSVALCQKLLQEPDIGRADVDYYLNYVGGEEEKGRKFAAAEELLEDIAVFTKLSALRSDPYVGKWFCVPWFMKAMVLAAALAVIGLPAIEIYFEFYNGNPDARRVFFWVSWDVMLAASFAMFRLWKRRKCRKGGS